MSDMWSSVAPAWGDNAAFVDDHLAVATAVLLDEVALQPGDAVLDLATGAGGTGLSAAERVGPEGRVVLADVAVGMVEVASRRAADSQQVSTLLCDQAAIDAPDGSFDAVVVRHGLMFAEAPADAVREAARVLRPGGRYAAMTWAGRADNPWLGLVLDAVGAQFGVPFPPPGVAGPFALDDPGVLLAALEAGGLEDVRVTGVPAPMRCASLEAWWARVPQLAGPLALALAGMEADVRDAIGARAVASAAAVARTTGDGVELDGAVLVASGRRP